MKYKYFFSFAFVTAALLLLPGLLHAQPQGFGAPTFGSGGVVDAPIDGGLSLLVAAGVGYGAKRIKDRRVKKDN